jgi:hypothetical protein
MNEIPRPFLNDDNFKNLVGKTRAELRELRRAARPSIPAPAPARPAIIPAAIRAEISRAATVKKIVHTIFSPKKKTEPAPARPASIPAPAARPAASIPAKLTEKETKKIIADTKKDAGKIEKFFDNAGIKKPVELSKPILKTKGKTIKPQDKQREEKNSREQDRKGLDRTRKKNSDGIRKGRT